MPRPQPKVYTPSRRLDMPPPHCRGETMTLRVRMSEASPEWSAINLTRAHSPFSFTTKEEAMRVGSPSTCEDTGAKEELEASLEQRHAEGDGLEGQSCGDPGGEGGGCRGDVVHGLENLKEDTVELLVDLPTAKAERDGAVDDAATAILAKPNLEKALPDANVEVISLRGRQLEADSSLHCLAEQGEQSKERASMLLAKLTAASFEVEALRAQVIDPGVDGAESRAELDAVRGEVSLLCGSREAKLFSESEVAWAKVMRLQAELKGGNAQSSRSVSANCRSSIVAKYLRSYVHRQRE
ncbi:hypothetical protein ACLOJK_007428 [Asimina triloba]